MLSRTVFHIELPDDDGAVRAYSVNVPFLDYEDKISLYLDERRIATATSPAVFAVPGGVIEVKTTTWGLSRMHYVPDDGEERQLRPDRASAEGMRARFTRRHPVASRVVGVTAVVVLLVGLVFALPQAVEWITHQEWLAPYVDPFTSPLTLPAWASTTLFVAGIVAALERALTLRNHWLVDADTWILGT